MLTMTKPSEEAVYNLIPRFILDKYAVNERNGTFTAVSLFVDVSGFTAVTNKLLHHGQEAVEVMADIMQAIFEPLVDAVLCSWWLYYYFCWRCLYRALS